MNITGENLDAGLVADDYAVTLRTKNHGDFTCEVFNLTSAELRCRLVDDVTIPQSERAISADIEVLTQYLLDV